ncbi:MAG TPA: hypothetical protein VJT09_12320 [Pyrinomonadaceae bacterium]|nr:hypothetical protein [Pyrinomonadaceae bacterium]
MEKIDRLGWAAGISFTSYGVRVGVRVNTPAALRLIESYFPPGWKPSPARVVERLYSFVLGSDGTEVPRGVRRFNLLYRDLARLARTRDVEEALEMFETDLQLHVATEARRRVFVHAGVVGWKGRAIIIPGRSYTGKTTMVAELVKAGATYYSDEYAVLDERGRVHPFARPLQIREAGTRRQQRFPVKTLGGKAGVKPLPVGLVVATRYKSGARWRPQQLSAGRGVLELLSQTVSARNQPGKAFAALQRVATRALVLKGTRGEAEGLASTLLNYLDD